MVRETTTVKGFSIVIRKETHLFYVKYYLDLFTKFLYQKTSKKYRAGRSGPGSKENERLLY